MYVKNEVNLKKTKKNNKALKPLLDNIEDNCVLSSSDNSEIAENRGKSDYFSIFDKLSKTKEKKVKSLRYYNFLKELRSDGFFTTKDDKKIERTLNCSTFLEFVSNKDFSKTKLANANFCHDIKFCPSCSFNESLKMSLKIRTMINYVKEKNKNIEFLFLTLTAPNVKGSEVADEVREYSAAFKRFVERKAIKDISLGCIRKLEMTYNSNKNSKSFNTYHPHYHVVLAVDSSYFKSDKYLSSEDFTNIWKSCKRDENIKIVDVRKFDISNDKSVAELCKYIGKDSDYLYSREVFKCFYSSLRNVRVFSFRGIFKEASRKYEDGKLDYLIDFDPVNYIYLIYYSWNGQDREYKHFKTLLLSEEDRKRLNLKEKNMKKEFLVYSNKDDLDKKIVLKNESFYLYQDNKLKSAKYLDDRKFIFDDDKLIETQSFDDYKNCKVITRSLAYDILHGLKSYDELEELDSLTFVPADITDEELKNNDWSKIQEKILSSYKGDNNEKKIE